MPENFKQRPMENFKRAIRKSRNDVRNNSGKTLWIRILKKADEISVPVRACRQNRYRTKRFSFSRVRTVQITRFSTSVLWRAGHESLERDDDDTNVFHVIVIVFGDLPTAKHPPPLVRGGKFVHFLVFRHV